MNRIYLAIVLILPLTMLTGCSSSKDATEALHKQGFTDVVTDGWAGPFQCSDDDWYATKFTAKNPKGETVSGVACSGFIFKNTTIRW